MKTGKHGPTAEKIENVFPAEKKKLDEIRKLISSALHKHGFSPGKIAGVEIAVVEHCENLIKHAYAGNKGEKGTVDIQMEIKHPVAKIKISDSAPEFNMHHAKLPELSERIKKGIGGKMGVRIIMSMFDEVKYLRKNGHNVNVFIIKDKK